MPVMQWDGPAQKPRCFHRGLVFRKGALDLEILAAARRSCLKEGKHVGVQLVLVSFGETMGRTRIDLQGRVWHKLG